MAPIAMRDSQPSIAAASGVIARICGRPVANRFHFEQIPSSDGLDAFTIKATGGEVFVAGTSPVAMCRGAYDYLRNDCHCQVSWSGDNVRLPNRLPDTPLRSVHCPNRYRHYFNVCTFGYTTVWWNWRRWQHEIDWMALHGINMPLAMNGQEKVWQRVFRQLGEPEASISAHFTGPAFLPWHRMGNVDRHMGPLPQSWIDSQAALQKKILGQERSLGMTPVVPGFSGFVPVDYDSVHPGVHLSSPTSWAGFPPTKFVDPRSPEFVRIGKSFIDEYRKEFGSDHLYLCDTFNEQDPQFPAATESQDLRATGNSVYQSIAQSDPEGVWVTQGWLFYNAKNYWSPPRTESYLGGVPSGRLIVLDLASNEHEIWREQPAVRESGWIYNTLHNYGQTTNLFGNLQSCADTATTALNDAGHGRMLGMGLTPEGIDQNPVLYELMTDLMWTTSPVKVADWVKGYVTSRYGRSTPEVEAAWQLLLETVYGDSDGWARNRWRVRPAVGAAAPDVDFDKLRRAATLLAASAPLLRENTLYRRDLVDVTKTWLGDLTDVALSAAQYSYDSDHRGYVDHKRQFFDDLKDLDQLMATRSEHRLSTWIADARTWGKTLSEKDLLERNARMQVTVWGGPELYDYANKEWAGLNADFIQGRWKLFFDSLEKGPTISGYQAPDFLAWETSWAGSTKPIQESHPADSVNVALEILSKHAHDLTNLTDALHLDTDPGVAVGKPVIDSGGDEGSSRPEFAVDGKLGGRYWSASPAPQWLQVDLQENHRIDRVALFPYFGDGRYYQYKVEVSLDGQAWTTVVDESANTVPSSILGYHHQFTPSPARYVRVTMLKNSANIGVHLYEFRIYDAK